MKLTRRFTEIFFACLWLMIPANVYATDVTISAQTWTNLPFNASNLGTDRSITVTATNGSATVTSSAAFPANIVGIGGFKVAIGGTTYTVSSIASTSSLTLTTNFSGSTGSAVMTLYKYVLLRAYATASFQPYGETYVIQPGTPGSGSFYKQVAASIINSGSSNVLYTPEFTLPATTNATINNQATYVLGWYRPDNSLIQFLVCGSVQQLAIPTSTPTTFGALCTYNSPGGVVPPNNQVYTTTQIDNRFPSCTSGQMIYYAANGNVQSCLSVGTNLSITGGTLNASGGGGGGGITINSTTITGGTSGYLLYDNAATVGKLALGSTLTISGGTLKNTGIPYAVNAIDYNADPTGSSNSTTALVNWITACQAAGARVCYLPGGTYLTDPITLSLNGLRIVGDGREKSILKARVANNAVIAITGANYFVNTTIDGIGFVGQGKTSGSSGHCVSISDSSGGTAQFSIINSSFSACGGKGLYIPYMFAGRFANNIFDEIGDNHMEIQGGSATIIEGNDFKTLEASKVALWVYSGNPVISGNNGIEPDSGASTVWGRFGRSTSEGDSTDSYVLGATFTGNNVEDFKGVGWQFRTGSGGSLYSGNTFISPSSGTVTALYYYFLSGTELGIWNGGTFTLQGTAAWTNSQPVHARGYAPFYVSGTNTPATFYEWNAAEARTLPYMRPKLLAGTTKNGLQVSEFMTDAFYDSSIAGTLTGTSDPSGNASRVLLQNGSAARPVFGSSVDSTTGMYFGSNTIGLTIGGTARFTLTSTALTITPKTTFSPTSTLAGLNAGSVGGDPSSLSNGDIWYDSTGNLLRARINGATVSLGAGGGGSPGGSSGNLQWNSSSSFAGVSGSTVTSLGYIALAPTLSTSGSPNLFSITGPAHTGLAADTEANDVLFNLSRSVQFTAGGAAFATQRAIRIQAPTYAFTSADTITQAITLGLNTPTAGTNATITESIGLQIAPSANAHLGLDINHQASASGDLMRLGLNGTYIYRVVPVAGDLNYVFADSALGTTATDGFVYFPSMAGVPSGVPTGYTGTIPLVIDTTNSRLYGRIGGSWVNLSGSGGSGLTIGTTTIASGTAGRLLYEATGNVLGEVSTLTSDGSVLTMTRAGIGTTSTDGIILQNTTAAAAGAQQYSPRLRLTGQGWKTNATAASQTVDWVVENIPVQGSANPTTYLGLSSQVNGGGYTSRFRFNSDSSFYWNNGSGFEGFISPDSGDAYTSQIGNAAATALRFRGNNGVAALTFLVGSSGQFGFKSTAFTSGAPADSVDTGLARAAAGVIRATNGSTGIGSVLIGTSTDSVTGNFTVMASNAATNAIVDIARLGVNSTGTAAAGFGGRLSFSLESSTTNDQVAALQSWAWTDATHASRTSYLAWSIVSSATTTEMLRLDPNGLRIPEIASAATPAANNVYLYAKDKTGVSTLYYKKDDGTEVEIGSGGGGSPGGSNTQIQYNNAGSFGGISGLTTNGSTTLVQTSSSAAAFESGPNGSTNPVFRLVNNVASAATGLSVTGNAAGSGVALTVLSSGTNEDIVINPKGSGAIQIGTGPFARFDSAHNSNFTASTGVLKLGNDLWLSSNLAAVGLNAYYNGANFVYAQTDPAFLFGFNSNRNTFKIQAAASGTAGNTITFSAGLAVLSDTTVGVNKESSTGAQFHAVSGSSSRVTLRADSASSNTVDIAQFTVNGSTTAGDFVGLASGGAVKVRRQTYSGSGTQTLNLANGTVHELTVTGTTTIALSNIQNGGMYIIAVIQDATGGRSVTLPSTIKLPGGSWIFTTAANARDEFHCYSDGTNLYCMPQADVK